jgi:hypothetical protein
MIPAEGRSQFAHASIGLPQKSRIFLRCMRLLPPRAGITQIFMLQSQVTLTIAQVDDLADGSSVGIVDFTPPRSHRTVAAGPGSAPPGCQ